MPTYDRNRLNHYSDNPYDAVPYGPRLRRNDNNNRSHTVLNHRRNLPPTTIQNRYNSDGYNHQNSNNYRHSLNSSNHRHHHHPHQQHHHQQQQQIVPFDNNVEHHDAVMSWEGFDSSDRYPVSRGYHLHSEETMIVSNGEIQEWYYVYHTLLVLVDHHHDDTAEQSTSNNEGLSEEGISKCLKLKTKGDDYEEEGICVICQEDLFPREEEQEEDNDKEKVAAISPCGHEYHYNCVVKWLQQKNSCPLCKATPRLDF